MRSIIIAFAALFVALGGTAAAAAVIVDSPDDLAPGVVTSSAIKDGGILAKDLSVTAIPQFFSAKVRQNGTFVKGHHAISSVRITNGTYAVKFDRPVRDCIFVATPRGLPALTDVSESAQPNTIEVRTSFPQLAGGGVLSSVTDTAFDLIGTC